MARKRTRAARKQQLAAKLPLTRDYQPIMVHHWGIRPRDLPLFTFLSVQAMLYDPTIRLGLAMRAAPVYQTEFGFKQEGQWTPGVEAKNEAVGEFVYRQLQRIWQQDIGALVKSQLWGHAAGEVLLKLSENNMVEVDRLLERHPNDVRALKRAGQNVGIRISRLTRTGQGNLDLEWPKGYWTTFNAEPGTFYGTSILLGAYSPWYDKWCDGGALDVRRLYMHKDAYVGCSISYPEGDLYVMPDGSEVPARDLARQMIEQIVAGGVVALPSDVDERGNRKWELKPATVASNPAHILKYPQDLDTEMLRGLEVPDDIFTSDSTSSGAWAGKKVPLSAFYAGIDIWITQLIKDLCRCIFEPLVLLNFGRAEDFQIAHKPLAQQAMEQQNQGGQPQQQPGEQPGGGGMADLFGGMGGEGQPGGEGEQAEGGTPSLADLLGSPAAQQARQGGGQAMQMSLDAAIGRGVVDAAKIVVASRAQVDAALVRMAGDTNPWQPYKGPRGGTGWVHSGTGVIAYQIDQPGAHETEGSDEGKPKEVAAKHDAGRGVRTGGTRAKRPSFGKAWQTGKRQAELSSSPEPGTRWQWGAADDDFPDYKGGSIAELIDETGESTGDMIWRDRDGYTAIADERKDVYHGPSLKDAKQAIADERAKRALSATSPAVQYVTETPEFKRWFGDSKVVDKSGKPLVVYHGTGGDFDEFSIDKSRQRDDSFLGQGMYFSSDPDRASAYAESAGSTANVKPVYLRIENPYRANLGEKIPPTPELIKQGYDGVIYDLGEDVWAKLEGREPKPNELEIVVFDASQIKSSTGNQGTFNPDDPDIRMSHADNPWTPFPGPRGGHRWRNTATGSIRYQKERPAASDTGDEPEPTQAKVSNEAHVAAVQKGDVGAAERLLKQNGGLIYNMARKFARNHDELDDYQQEARIAVLRAAGAFDASKGFQFSTLATRAIINHLTNISTRSHKRQNVWRETQQDEEGQQVEPSVQPDRLPMEEQERQATVMKAVQSLPERVREIVQRRYGLDGEPPESASDIGRRVGLSPQRVAKILEDARGKLRRSLEDYSIQLAIRMAGEVNPWSPYKGARGGQGWVRSDTKEVRYQKDRPGAHEGGPGQQPEPAAPAKPPETSQELMSALDAVAANPQQHGLDQATADKLKQAETAADKIAVLDEATGHKFDTSGTSKAVEPAAKNEQDAKAAAKAAAKAVAKAKALEVTKHLDDDQLLEALSKKDDPSLYFETEGVTMMPVSQLQNIRARPGGIANAMRFMYAAAIGEMPKRGPVSVMKTDKGFEIHDGNSTFNIAKQAGWENLPVKFVDPQGNPVESPLHKQEGGAEPETAAPLFSRHELPQILGADKPEFYSLLHDAGIKTELKSVPVGELKGIQRDLNAEKVSGMAATIREKGTLGPWPLLASNDGYIVDGHHRWAAEKEVDPTRKAPVVQVDLPVHELISKLESFPKSFKAGTDEAPRNWQDPKTEPPKQSTAVFENLFTEEELKLPKEVTHPYKTMEDVYKAAYYAKETFDLALNHGQGVDKALGGKTVAPKSQEEFMEALKSEGPVVIIAGVKGEKRAKEKVQQDYEGDWSKIGDMVRATVAVDDVGSIPVALGKIREYMRSQGWELASTPKDRFSRPTPEGYRDVMMKFAGPNGLTAELQLNTKEMIFAKEGEGHDLYNKSRKIEGRAREEKRELTPEEDRELQQLIAEQKRVYSAAWEASLKGAKA
jgi:RNA polymerase sigma factor (sigma-70 family)